MYIDLYDWRHENENKAQLIISTNGSFLFDGLVEDHYSSAKKGERDGDH